MIVWNHPDYGVDVAQAMEAKFGAHLSITRTHEWRGEATAYGVDTGYWGRIALLRDLLRNIALAGAAEVAAELGMDMLGAGITARISTRAAQGLGAGLLTARLGLRAMDACRPIPWAQQERPRLADVRSALLDVVSESVRAS